MDDLAGRIAFVTGAASGIGLEISRSLAQRGAKVMLADVDADGLAVAKTKLLLIHPDIETVICDVRDPVAVQAAADAVLARFGKIHIVVNNAGVAIFGPTGKVALDDWRWIVDINLMGVAYGVEVFAPLMRAQGEGGYFINTASIAGHIAGTELGPYTATKFGVVGLSEVMRQEMEKDDIGVSVLCPAWVQTDIFETRQNRPSAQGSDNQDEKLDEFATAVQTGIDPADVADWTVECMLAGRFYIFTHPSMKRFVRGRMAEIQADFAACSADPRFSDK